MGKLKGLAKRTVKSANIIGTTQPIRDNFVTDYNQGIAVYVQPPSRRLVNINSVGIDVDDDDSNYYGDGLKHAYSGKFFLSFPYVVFRLCYNRSSKGYSGKYVYRAESLRVAFASQAKPTKLFVPPLFNLDGCLRVCVSLPNLYFDALEECMKKCVAVFWSTDFNDSMFDAYGSHYERRSLMGDPRKWQKKTKKQPEWVPNGRSMKEYNIRMGKFCSAAHIRQGYDDEDAYDDY